MKLGHYDGNLRCNNLREVSGQDEERFLNKTPPCWLCDWCEPVAFPLNLGRSFPKAEPTRVDRNWDSLLAVILVLAGCASQYPEHDRLQCQNSEATT